MNWFMYIQELNFLDTVSIHALIYLSSLFNGKLVTLDNTLCKISASEKNLSCLPDAYGKQPYSF